MLPLGPKTCTRAPSNPPERGMAARDRRRTRLSPAPEKLDAPADKSTKSEEEPDFEAFFAPFSMSFSVTTGSAFSLSRLFLVVFNFARDFLARGAAFPFFFLVVFVARPFFFVFRVRFAFFLAALFIMVGAGRLADMAVVPCRPR